MHGDTDPFGPGHDIVLVSPRIATNTGNIIRLCANVGARLHLVEPLGFSLDDAKVRRSGLDYHDLTCVRVHGDWASVRSALGAERRWVGFSAEGSATVADFGFVADDVLVFGAEPAGLPPEIRLQLDLVSIPMVPGSRSLNLANAVAVVAYESWRQRGYVGAAVNSYGSGESGLYESLHLEEKQTI